MKGSGLMAEKSALYPMVNWDVCIEFVEMISSFNLKAVSYSEVAKKYGLNSPTAKSFTSKLSSCKQFGLITTSGGSTIQLTDTCKRILYPTGEDTTLISRACFSMPPLYNKLVAAYDGKAIPSQEVLSNILMRDHKIQKSVKDVAARVFIESAEQLGLIKGGILCYSETDEMSQSVQQSPIEFESVIPGAQTAVTKFSEALQPYAGNSSSNESDYITQSIPFESGKVARFSIPVDATQDDLLLLHDMFDVILKRKFKFEV